MMLKYIVHFIAGIGFLAQMSKIRRIIALLAFALIWGVSVAAPQVTKLAEGVYGIFEGGYHSLIVISANEVLVTDTANSQRAEILKQEIAKITPNPVTKIALTHEHYDHVGGTQVFGDAEIICQRNCLEIFELDVMGSVPDRVDISYEKYHKIELGDKVIELHHFVPGDGVATSIIYLPDVAIIHSADLYESRKLIPGMFLDDANYLGIRRILNEISDWKIDHALNVHALESDPQALRENIEYYNNLYEAVHARMNEIISEGGLPALFASAQSGELYNSIDLPRYKDWENYDTELPAHVRRMAKSIFHGG